jgi:hypothetical protein
MNRVVTRRTLVLSSCGVALLGCERIRSLFADDPSADERFLMDTELLHEPLTPAAGSFSGVLEARRFMSYAGCADQGTALRWLVLERSGIRMPLRIVSENTFVALCAGDEGALENDELHGEPVTPDETARLGLALGERVTIDAVCAALHFSGTLTLDPIYGLCARRITRS